MNILITGKQRTTQKLEMQLAAVRYPQFNLYFTDI